MAVGQYTTHSLLHLLTVLIGKALLDICGSEFPLHVLQQQSLPMDTCETCCARQC